MKKKVFFLTGGLANQLFQIIGGSWLANQHNFEITFDKTYVDRQHDKTDFLKNLMPELNFKVSKFRRFIAQKIPFFNKLYFYFLGKFHLIKNDEDLNNIKINEKYIIGYFQNFKFFDLSPTITNLMKTKLYELSPNKFDPKLTVKPYLVVHVRCGDFLGKSYPTRQLDEKWYINAYDKIKNNHKFLKTIILTNNKIDLQNYYINFLNHVAIYEIVDPEIMDTLSTFRFLMDSKLKLIGNSTFAILAAKFSQGIVYVPDSLISDSAESDLVKTFPITWNKIKSSWI